MNIKNIMLLADAYAGALVYAYSGALVDKRFDKSANQKPSIDKVVAARAALHDYLLSTIKNTFTVAEQSTELDAGMAAQHYCRGLWGAARGHSDWRKVHEHFANGYKQGRYDEVQAQGPSPWPGGMQEFEIRGKLASGLKCWHRLTGEEAENLITFFAKQRYAAEQPAQSEPI